MKPKWLLFLLIALLLVSCKPETKSVDLPKAIKLEPGTITKVSPLPEGYSYITFTLYTPETYTGNKTASFSIKAIGTPKETEENKDLKSLSQEATKAVSSTPTVKESITREENVEGITLTLLDETENVAFYLEDSVGGRMDPAVFAAEYGESILTTANGKPAYIDINGNTVTFEDLAKRLVTFLKPDIDGILDTETEMLTGYRYQNQENHLDLDGNGKMNVYFVAVDNDACGYFYAGWKALQYGDCFYVNLRNIALYDFKNLATTSESETISTFVHEYVHFIDRVFYQDSRRNHFITEGFAHFVVHMMHDLYPLVEDKNLKRSLISTAYHQTPFPTEWSTFCYAVGSRFYYYLWKTYPQGRGENGVDTFFPTLMDNNLSLEETVRKISGKELKDVYREFWLSAFFGMGYDFGNAVTPFAYSANIHFTPADLETALNLQWIEYKKGNVPYCSYQPYHPEKDNIIQDDALPECAFAVGEWYDTSTGTLTGLVYEADPGVETWLFAMDTSVYY